MITGNKRLSPEEVEDYRQLAQQGLPGLSIRYVDWFGIQPFKAQLDILRKADIMVSGIGTALFYSAFLPPGSVCINTGWRDGSIPTYGEDILGMSNRRTRFLYMPLEQVRKGITRADLEKEISKAATMVTRGVRVQHPEARVHTSGLPLAT